MPTSTPLRLVVAAALATLLGGLTLRPLIEGSSWFTVVLLVVATVAASGTLARSVVRWSVAVVSAQLAAVVLLLTVLYVHGSAVLGVLPGPAALRALRSLLHQGFEITRGDGPPVPATRGLVLLTACGIAVVAIAVDLIAVTLRRPAVAGLPLLAIYCIPAASLPSGLAWYWFGMSAAGYLLLVGADASDRIRAWGRTVGGSDRSGPWSSRPGMWGGGTQIGSLTLVLALIVPTLIPGLNRQLLPELTQSGDGDGNGDGGTITTVNPILNLRQALTSRDNRILITYQTTMGQPAPLRIVADDDFDGNTWKPSPTRIPSTKDVAAGGLPQPPGLGSNVTVRPQTTHIGILDYDQSYLPLPYPATQVAFSGQAGSWRYDDATLNVIGVHTSTRNLDYTVRHLEVRPTAAQLRSAGDPPPAVSTYLRVPRLPQEVRDTAAAVAGTGSYYDQALRLQQWLRNAGGFAYSEVPSGHGNDSSTSAVADFLRDKRGYCVQFASAMAVMARLRGIPARVAVGFLPGRLSPDGKTWSITLRDAHAWPELYFAGAGWVRFEPTPSTRSGPAPTWAVPSGSDTSPQVSTTTSVTAPSNQPHPDQSGGTTRTDRSKGTFARALDQVAGAAQQAVLVLLVALLVALTPAVAAASRRALRRRRARDPVQQAEAAWDELQERLGDLRLVWAPTRTPRSIARSLVHSHGLGAEAAEAMQRLVHDLEAARYMAPDQGGARTGRELSTDVTAVVREVAGTLPRAVRRRARWLPSSGVAALTGAPLDPTSSRGRRAIVSVPTSAELPDGWVPAQDRGEASGATSGARPLAGSHQGR